MEHHSSKQVNDHVTTATLQIELTNATGTYIDDVNDDCLLEVFSYMTVMDLCSLAETCTRFIELTRRVFPKEIYVERSLDRDFKETSKYWIRTNRGDEGVENVYSVERMFKHFGSRIVVISVDTAPDVMHLVAKHCVGTLKDLRIGDMEIPEDVAVELKPVFQQLQKLAFDHATIECSADVFRHCDSLTELKVVGQRWRSVLLENNFPKLQRFTFNYMFGDESGWWSSLTLLGFFEHHATLQCLELNAPHSKVIGFLQKLANICQQLQELTLHVYCDAGFTLDVSYFASLKRLELLQYNFDVTPSIARLDTLKSLESLKIEETFDSKEILDALPLLKSLRELDVYLESKAGKIPWKSLAQLTTLRLSNNHGHAGDNIVDIIRQLPNLKEIEIDRFRFELNEKKFSEIVKVAQGRANVLTLKCRCEFTLSPKDHSTTFNKKSKVKLINMKYRTC